MTQKSEVQMILDAVAGFNDSINGFKDNIIATVKTELKDQEARITKYFDIKIEVTNQDVSELKSEVKDMKENAADEKTIVRNVKSKLGWAIAVGVFFSTTIIGIAQYFIFKALG